MKPTKTLSAILFCAGVAPTVHAADQATKIQALQLLEENRISYEEFRALFGTSTNKTVSNVVTSSNYSDIVTSGNYSDIVTSANYSDIVTAGNYANIITSANYGSVEQMEIDNVPQPEVNK